MKEMFIYELTDWSEQFCRQENNNVQNDECVNASFPLTQQSVNQQTMKLKQYGCQFM